MIQQTLIHSATCHTSCSRQELFGRTEVLAQLGRHAFSEADPPSNVCLLVLRKEPANDEHRITSFQITKSRPAEDQAALLLAGANSKCPELTYRRRQAELFDIPLNPICYWLTDNVLKPFREGREVREVAECKVTCKTSNNSKFVRFWWEAPPHDARWKPYEKESVGLRFLSSPLFVVDWSNGAQQFYYEHFSAQLPNRDYLFRESIVSSKIKRPNVTARVLHNSALADMSVNQIFPLCPERTMEPLCALLNSRVSVYYLRLLNPTVNCNPTDLERIPLAHLLEDDAGMVDLSNNWKRGAALIGGLYRLSQVRRDFTPSPPCATTLKGRMADRIGLVESIWGQYSKCLQDLDLLVGRRLGLEPRDWKAIEFDISVASEEEEDADSGSEEVDFAGFAVGEEFARTPESVAEDLIQELVLSCVGHRWPKEIEAREPLPAWVDRDGVIPLTRGGGKGPLIERVRDRLSEGFPSSSVAVLEGEFEDTVGVPLDQWLGGRFVERHTSQFRKRPIAWQLETGARGRGKNRDARGAGPVFSCLVYFHKLGEDLLPKIRTQHIGPLRGGFETELRTLERLANPTPEQQGRKLQLDQWAEELKAFDHELEIVSNGGFGPEGLRPALRQYAINDALLSLMACWLRRLEQKVRGQRTEHGGGTGGNPLATWCKDGEATGLHPELAHWIDLAFSRLDYFCAAVGTEAPTQEVFMRDPTSDDLAPLVCANPRRTVEQVLGLACGRWWERFGEVVLDPLKGRSKQKKEELERVKEELEQEEVKRDYGRHIKLADRRDELKREIKSLREEIEDKTEKGKELRSQIEAWACPEAATWESWLMTQPLFDGAASLDGKRRPPGTIAEFVAQESAYSPDINDGVRVNIAPLQKAGLLHADVLDFKDADKAIADRAEWRADERRWVREGKLPRPGWWPTANENSATENATGAKI